jgi:hypothetical protein
MDDLAERLNQRAKELPQELADQANEDCGQCGPYGTYGAADYADDPDVLIFAEAAARITELEAEAQRLREVAPVAKLTIDEWDRAVRSGAPMPVILEIGNGLRNFTCTIARAALCAAALRARGL